MIEAKFLYMALADKVAKAIKSNAYVPNEKLPSVRELMRSEAVSQITAMRALIELENRGLVYSRKRSGFYVALGPDNQEPAKSTRAGFLALPEPTQSSNAPTIVTIQHLTRELFQAFHSADLISFGAAELSSMLIPSADINTAARNSLRKYSGQTLATPDPHGVMGLRKAVAQLLLSRGMLVSARDVLITAGETDAMELALRGVTKPGDIVAVESPTYFGILQEIEEAGLQALEISTNPKTGIDVNELIRKADEIGIKAVVLNPTFENPFGCCMQNDALRRVAEAMHARSIPIIEDDVYGHLGFEGTDTRSLASLDDAGNTIYCGSFSKVLAPGLRVGWCVPGMHAEKIKAIQARRFIKASALAQFTIMEYLLDRRFSKHCAHITNIFAHQKPIIRNLIMEHFPAGTTATDPSGGFLFWVEVPAPFDSMIFYRKALEVGISIAPGAIFSASGRFNRAFRLSVGQKLTPEVRKALKKLGKIAFEVQHSLRN